MGSEMLTVLEFAGSAVVGVLYLGILAAMVSRKRRPEQPTTPEGTRAPRVDQAA